MMRFGNGMFIQLYYQLPFYTMAVLITFSMGKTPYSELKIIYRLAN